MSGFPNKVSVPSAIKERNNFPLGNVHQTTSDIGLTQITTCVPIVPTDKVNLSISSFAYLQSMLAPTMGSCDLVQRAFFVPHDFVCADWKSFIAGKANNQDSTTQPTLPKFDMEIFEYIFRDIFNYYYVSENTIGTVDSDDLNKWLTSADDMETTDVAAKIMFFDFHDVYIATSGNAPTSYDYFVPGVPFTDEVTYAVYFKFKPLGKAVHNLFIQLGYAVELGRVPVMIAEGEDEPNLLAVFSLLKIFIDYYVDPRYNWVDFSTFFREFSDDTNGFNSLNLRDKCLLIHDIFVLCVYCWFDNDLFTSSWQSHESPALNGLFKSISLTVDNVSSSVNESYQVQVNNNSNVDTRVVRTNGSSSILTDTMLSMLKAVSSYFKRNSIAGTRPIDVAFARFGVHIPEVVAQRAQYLGSHRVPLKITDIMAQSAGSDNVGNTSILGERAGQGIVAGKPFNISFESKFFYGYLIVVSHIVPRTMYYQGIKPWNLFKERFDFFTPEFEEIGAEPIPNAVLYADQQAVDDNFTFARNGIFGYGPRYYSYKFGFDTLSGDFRLKRYYNSLRPYQMFRELTDPDAPDANDLKNDSAFRQYSDKARASYDKMFVSQDIQDDHFVINYIIDYSANRPMAGIGLSLLGKIEGGKQSLGLRPNGKYL